jgi:hypothetical protein
MTDAWNAFNPGTGRYLMFQLQAKFLMIRNVQSLFPVKEISYLFTGTCIIDGMSRLSTLNHIELSMYSTYYTIVI